MRSTFVPACGREEQLSRGCAQLVATRNEDLAHLWWNCKAEQYAHIREKAPQHTSVGDMRPAYRDMMSSTPTPSAHAQSRQPVPQSDSDTVSRGSVSDNLPGMFNVPQGWHSDSDTVSTRSVSDNPLVCFTCFRVAQRLRHRPRKFSLGQPSWYVLRAPGGGTTSSSSSSAWCGPASAPAQECRGRVQRCRNPHRCLPRRRHPHRCRRS